MRLWHPHFPDLSIERDETDVAAHVAAGWLKGKPRRAFVEADAGESLAEVLEEARAPKKSTRTTKAKSADAGETSTGDGEE